MDTDQIVAAILAAAQTAADGHNRADSYITNYRTMLAKLREPEPQANGSSAPDLSAASK